MFGFKQNSKNYLAPQSKSGFYNQAAEPRTQGNSAADCADTLSPCRIGVAVTTRTFALSQKNGNKMGHAAIETIAQTSG